MNRKQRRADGKAGKGASSGGGSEDVFFRDALLHHQAGRVVEAEAGYRDVLSRNPRHPGALCYLGLLAHQSGHSEDGIALVTKAIAVDKRNPDLHYNLARVFADIGRGGDALEENRKAIALKPDYIDAHGNLAALLLLRGEREEALTAVIRGLKIGPSASLKSTFAMAVQSLDPAKVTPSDDLARYLTLALTEPWARPRDLAGFAIGLLMRDPVIAGAIERIARAVPQRASGIFYFEELAAMNRNDLLRAVLHTSPITNVDLERLLTATRRAVLNELSMSAATVEQWLPLMSLIAQQCFINDYVFDGSEQEGHQVSTLYDNFTQVIARADSVTPIQIAVLASYLPLHSIDGVEKLASRQWPDPVQALVAQQISNPKSEQDIRGQIENLTPIKDAVSEKVRAQYEESPYPQWSRAVAHSQPVPVDHYIRMRFPKAPYKNLGSGPLDVLVAGCGTGMHAIQRAQQFARVNVLAIDLSLSSLAYAIRKTREMGVGNIRYAQADILEFTSAKPFDVIDSSGVLHHLSDPLAGWKRLADLVRPGGLMHIGLYSAMARQAVNVARERFADQGRQFSPAEARRLRTEILDLPTNDELRGVTSFSDFFSMSEFRDLLFHVQEHQFTLPQIAAILKEIGFTFLGFETQAHHAYAKRFPDDPAGVNLDNWHVFETENPATFAHMYQFWLQKS